MALNSNNSTKTITRKGIRTMPKLLVFTERDLTKRFIQRNPLVSGINRIRAVKDTDLVVESIQLIERTDYVIYLEDDYGKYLKSRRALFQEGGPIYPKNEIMENIGLDLESD